MDTHSNLPFSLEYKLGKNNPTFITVHDFSLNEHDIPDHSSIELVENVHIEMLFKSEDENAKFFFEGLESVPERFVEEEDGVPYLPPSSYSVVVFQNDSYPLIPGKYLVRIECFDQKFYTLIKVVPNRVTEQQWEIMKEEVEGELTGLAQDLIKSRMGLVSQALEMLAPKQISQFLVLQKHYAKALAAITDLYTKANYRIKKNYQMVPVERAKTVDERSFIHRLRFPENQTELKTPVNMFEYDLPENRWIKRIVKYVIGNLKEFNSLVSGYAESIRHEIDSELSYYAQFQTNTKNVLLEKEKVLFKLDEYLDITRKMQKAFQVLQSAKWYQDVKEYEHCSLPHVMQLDARYRVLYQLYREMKQDTPELGIDPTYALQWKRTDKLYEIWGFIQLVKVLKEMNFIPVEGWIYDSQFMQHKTLIPTLKPGTMITFVKDELTIKLVYDGEIPHQSQDTDPRDKPIYISGNNNRPDAMLNVFDGNVFVGSLIVDFKYRAKKYVWDHTKITTSYKTTTMSQLLSYGNSCKSIHLYGENRGITYINPVLRVWAMYPSQFESSRMVEDYDDHHLSLVKLSPGLSKSHVRKAMEDTLSNIASRKQEMMQ